MENTDKYTASVDGMPKESETGEFVETPSESAFFQQLEKNLKKYAADMSAPNPLEMLCENFHRLHRLFVTFGHLWPVHNGIIQKACAWYLAYAKPSEEEIHTLMETLEGLTRSAYSLAEGSALTTRMRKFFITGEQGLRHLFNYEDYPVESQPDITLEIREDGRVPLLRTVPWISKRIHQDEGEETEIAYCIDVNEIHSPELSFSEFVAVYRKLGDYLDSCPHNAEPDGN